ncbi:MAG: cupin domain-containing protein [Oscillospiraceae bacterium]|nr:cupin domain-containing protein [Oscillospiraceae bacterium]
MNDFPAFMKQPMNRIPTAQQNTPDIDGYYYEGQDGSQICFWTYLADRDSKENVHAFDEYVVCIAGEYVEIFDGKEHILHAGDELLIPKGTPHHGRVKKGTRTIHAFGGKRITAE